MKKTNIDESWEDEAKRQAKEYGEDTSPGIETVGDLRNIWNKRRTGELGGQVLRQVPILKDILGVKDLYTFIKKLYFSSDDFSSQTGLDALNVDDRISGIVDDNVELAFLRTLVSQFDELSDDHKLEDLRTTDLIQKYLADKFNGMTITDLSGVSSVEDVLGQLKGLQAPALVQTEPSQKRAVSETKSYLESIVEDEIQSILKEFSRGDQTGPGALSTASSDPKPEDSLSAAVGNLEAQAQQSQGQLAQQGELISQIAQLAQTAPPDDPEAQQLAQQIMGTLSEGYVELEIDEPMEPVPQQGVQRHHEDDGEGRMANSQLLQTLKNAEWLFSNIQDCDSLDSWVQAKLTKAADYLESVRNYMEYSKMRSVTEEAPRRDK